MRMKDMRAGRTVRMMIALAAIFMVQACGQSGDTTAEKGPAPDMVRPEVTDGTSISGIISRVELALDDLEERMDKRASGPVLDEKENEFILDDAPAMGPDDAELTMVVFSDFECPYCSRFAQAGEKVVEEFPDQVRLVFMHFPLDGDCNAALNRPFHKNACEAAEVSEVAQRAGKFWEFHDMVFDRKKADPDSLKGYAQELGLNMNEVEKAINESTYREEIKAQAAQLLPTGGRGTPTVFINGRMVKNARWDVRNMEPIYDFINGLINPESEMEEEQAATKVVDDPSTLPAAKVVLEDGTLLNDRLKSILDRLNELEPAERQKPKPPSGPDANKVYEIDVSDNPYLGPKDAPVTIVMFSDFTCPHCERMGKTLEEVHNERPDKVKVVFMSVVSGRANSTEAHMAAMSAYKQDSFWEMHDLIFQNRRQLSNEKLTELASEIGLDMEKFEEDFTSDETKQLLIGDLKQANEIGIRSTPTMFMNGKLMKLRDKDSIVNMIDRAAE